MGSIFKGNSISILSIIIFTLFYVSTFGKSLTPTKKITQYVLNVWQTEQGLPQNSVRSIIQTKDGYLWFATEEGIAVFDGVKFTVFNKQNTENLKENFVHDLLVDSKNQIWIATHGGGLSKYANHNFSNFSQRDGLPTNFIFSITEDNKSNIWIGTEKGLVLRTDNGFKNYNKNNGFIDTEVKALCYINNTLWIGTSNGLYTYKQNKFSVYNKPFNNKNLSITTIKADKNSLWIGTEGEGLIYLNFDGNFNIYNESNGLSNNIVRTTFVDDNQTVWVGTTYGLNRIIGDRIETYTVADGLNAEAIYSIYGDKEGSLWIGTSGGGLARLRDGKFTPFGVSEGLNYDIIWSVYKDKKGDVWVGTDGGGVNIVSPKGVKTITEKNGLNSGVVFTTFQDSKNNYWIGTYKGGLTLYKNGNIKNYTIEDGLGSNIIRTICEDRLGNIWIGTTNGLNKISNGKIADYTFTESDGLNSSYIRELFVDSKDRIWVGTRGGGIHIFDGNSFTGYTTNDGLSNNTIRTIFEDSNGDIWIGTSSGLNKFENGKIHPITYKNGLYDDPVFSIVEDDKKNIWISCNKGVYYVSLSQLNQFVNNEIENVESKAFGKADGMRSCECNGSGSPAGIKASDGTLWFPTIQGVATFQPSNIKYNKLSPPVHIEEFTVDGKKIENFDEITIEAGAENFEFHYTALSYIEPAKVKFKYMLEGFDKEWIDAGTRRVAYYTNIPPGDYSFKVIACNNDGYWNEEGAEVVFNFSAFIYQTIWFYLIIVSVVGFVGFKYYKHRMNLMKKRNDELQHQIYLSEETKKQLEIREEELKREYEKAQQARKALENEKIYLSQSVEKMLEEIEKFSKGDLTINLDSDKDDEISKLYSGFSRAVNNVRNLFLEVFQIIESTIESNSIIVEKTTQVANGTELQTSQATGVANAVEEMTDTIHSTNENIANAAEKIELAENNAKHGGTIVNQTIQGMNEISESVLRSSEIIVELGESSQDIGEVISVIDDIADQTNLLALNASIEAARAGENGRGFAVVADEVRKLSERTTNATKEISVIVNKIQNDVKNAVDSIKQGEEKVSLGKISANKAEVALSDIIKDSQSLSASIQQIVVASEQQSATSDDIKINIDSISAVTKDTSEAILNIAKLTDNMSGLTSQLQESIKHFKLN